MQERRKETNEEGKEKINEDGKEGRDGIYSRGCSHSREG
jgi:hypothetical protein